MSDRTTDELDPTTVAEHALGETATWLHVGRRSAAAEHPDAMSIEQLASPESIRTVTDRWEQSAAGYVYEAPTVVGSVAWALYLPRIRAVRERRVLVRLDPSQVLVDVADDHLTRVWWPTDARCEHVDEGQVVEAYRYLVDEAVTTLAPMVDVARRMVRIGRRGVWGHVVDVFNAAGPRYTDPDPARSRRELGLMERARAGTPLGQPAVVVDVPWRDGCRQTVRTSACCLAYRTPIPDSAEPRPWHGGPWERYCMACPLVPVDETVARARYWLDEAAPDHGPDT